MEQRSEFLPGTGRGTVRRAVEGSARLTGADDPLDHLVHVPKHVRRRNTRHHDAPASEPSLSNRVSLGPIPHIMRNAIDFDRQARLGTEEVEHIGARGMLSPKLPARRTLSQRSPQQDFGKAQRPTQLAGALDRAFGPRQNRRFPSTMLRMVPLPVPGRIYQHERQKSSPARGGGPSAGRWRGISAVCGADENHPIPIPDNQVTA